VLAVGNPYPPIKLSPSSSIGWIYLKTNCKLANNKHVHGMAVIGYIVLLNIRLTNLARSDREQNQTVNANRYRNAIGGPVGIRRHIGLVELVFGAHI